MLQTTGKGGVIIERYYCSKNFALLSDWRTVWGKENNGTRRGRTNVPKNPL